MTAHEAKRAAERLRDEAAAHDPLDDPNIPEHIRHDIEAGRAKAKARLARAREVVANSVARSHKDTRKMIKPFSDQFAETVAAIRLSDPSLTLEQVHERATRKTFSEARTHAFTMAATTDPTIPSAAVIDQFAAIDENLLASSVDHAQQVARDNAPKAPKPQLGQNYEAALKLIARSPEMPREQALQLARDAQRKDRELQIAREAAVSNPSPPGNAGEARA